ncbi:hypothetical protein [Achromobacter xylosoxidans]|uniref:Uncharacterized protein n=1 Tax=Alcaligenes xylosoxydans xylosoxydans TaxID=85698 RepID=A0A424WH85_ALCXX|nr:hypothetical protein [Achromobacter xylosoxidans]MBC9902922.1 hypothetical protein [Achromobacter xylosoxidans]MBD0868475.1 hypothetical protein [Achromobacter xylosoxidans]QNP83331.1 hypothetical protein IAG39_17355 [Achromobacter xylosoxidans]RPJ92634.1 hypothetical protein DY367_05780 [Achromobacter xylosoxidans]
MAPEALQLRIDHLTELDRRELVKLMGADAVRFVETRPADGRLGELDTLTAIVSISLATINAAGVVLAIWLAKGGRKVTLRDHLVIETAEGNRLVRKLELTGRSEDEIKAEVLKELQAAFSNVSTPAKEQ